MSKPARLRSLARRVSAYEARQSLIASPSYGSSGGFTDKASARLRSGLLRLRSSLPQGFRLALNQARTFLSVHVVPRGSSRRRLYLALKERLGTIKERRRRSSGTEPGREAVGELPATVIGNLPTFPDVAAPEVSIIIPFRDRLAVTVECLRSVAGATDGVAYEVIAVDDGSSSLARELLSRVHNLTLLTNAENVGFVRSCNGGAAAARGRYVLFLNNDTLVRPGWLQSMVAVMSRTPGAGLVGAKLLFPDGSIQEAGGIVFTDGSASNYGRKDDPHKPEYNFVREVDYCSAACLLVRADVFKKAKGFDARYSPAYYEDADLAFTARTLGYVTLYQPLARVIHFEGTSSGVDPKKGVKRFQVLNQRVFASKWEEELKQQYPPSRRHLLLASDRSCRPKVLVVDNDVPYYDRDAGGLRLDSMIQILQELGFGVIMLAHNRYAAEPYRSRLQQRGVQVLYGTVNVGSFLKSISPRLKFSIVCRPSIAWRYVTLIKRLAPECRLLYDTVDLHYLREERRFQIEGRRAAKKAAAAYRELELALIGACDATITVSEEEAAVVKAEVPHRAVYVVPTIHAVTGKPRPFHHRSGLLFVGSFAHPPNPAALRFFLEQIFPMVRTELPEIQLNVAGEVAPGFVQTLPSEGVVFHGWVEDIDEHIQGCRVMVAPMTFGAGVNGKITQALAGGLPVVTTSVGARGTGIVDGHTGVVTDNAEIFSRKVVDLYSDAELWRKLSTAGLKLAEERFSPAAARRSVNAMLESLTATPVLGA